MTLIEARAIYGSLIHAVPDSFVYPDERGIRSRLLRGRALCGVRGKDAWGGGGLFARVTAAGEPIPFQRTEPGELEGAVGHFNEVCPKCIRLRKAVTPA